MTRSLLMENLFRVLTLAVTILTPLPLLGQSTEQVYYQIQDIYSSKAATASRDKVWKPQKGDIPLEISGIDLLPDGKLAVAVRRGEIWLLDNYQSGRRDQLQFQRVASGLHEPMGLLARMVGGTPEFYVCQRSELTLLKGLRPERGFSEYRSFGSGWGVSGNYHEYAYGPKQDREGNLWVALNVGLGEKAEANSAWRGWTGTIDDKGSFVPVCCGFRSPSGLGANSAGDMFATDQQGEWIATCSLLHLRHGAYFGHPQGLKSAHLPGSSIKPDFSVTSGLSWPNAMLKYPELTPPAVWFPYKKAGQSTTDIVSVPDGFGPFAGQLLVGEFRLSGLLRVFLEKVDGEYQGAVFPFRSGFPCGVFRLCFGDQGNLFVGMTNRGWSSLGDASFGLQQLKWTGENPFEIKEIRATPHGFRLVFTDAVDLDQSTAVESYSISSYTYLLHQQYGSDEIESRQEKLKLIRVAEDRRSVELVFDSLRSGFVYEFHASGVRNASGMPLLHEDAYYTLNRIPKD